MIEELLAEVEAAPSAAGAGHRGEWKGLVQRPRSRVAPAHPDRVQLPIRLRDCSPPSSVPGSRPWQRSGATASAGGGAGSRPRHLIMRGRPRGISCRPKPTLACLSPGHELAAARLPSRRTAHEVMVTGAVRRGPTTAAAAGIVDQVALRICWSRRRSKGRPARHRRT